MLNINKILRQNAVTLGHSLSSFLLFALLTWFFAYRRPDPDYNDILSVMIGALATIVTVMFSAVLVALQLASAQFSPRITRAFFRENRIVQAAFYLFLFGIAFCLAIKFTYSTSRGAFLYPVLPVLAAIFGFFLISFVLPRFVFYIANAVNAASISREVALHAVREMEKLYGKEKWKPGMQEFFESPKPAGECVRITHCEAGFLDIIQHEKLAHLAKANPEHQFYSEVLVGNFISPDKTIMKVYAPSGRPVPSDWEKTIKNAFFVDKYRNYEQDVLFGVRQLVDMAIKAISPAVNDPTTCVNCLYYLGVIAHRFAQVPVPSKASRQAPANLHFREFSFEMLLDQSFDQIFQWGKTDYVVVSQILNTLTEVLNGIENPYCHRMVAKQLEEFELEKLTFNLPEHQNRVEKSLNRLRAVLKS